MLSRHSTDLVHPKDCPACHRLRALTLKRLGLDEPRTVAIQTWCRRCGLPVLMEVTLDYEFAKRNFYALDDQPMAHKHLHGETGNWGVHWRLDDVLAAVFPNEHLEACWPKPPWYEDCEGELERIKVIAANDTDSMKAMVDVELKMLAAEINRTPRSREQILQTADISVVYDTREVVEVFEVFGFRPPFAIVQHRHTGERGTLLFQDNPRFYFGFRADRVI